MTEYLRLDDIFDIINDQVDSLISETRDFARENPDIDEYMDYFQELISSGYEPYVSTWIGTFLENIDLNQIMTQKWENLQKIIDNIDHSEDALNEANNPKECFDSEREEARYAAICWQTRMADEDLSYGEINEIVSYLEELGTKYCLLGEFHENGVC